MISPSLPTSWARWTLPAAALAAIACFAAFEVDPEAVAEGAYLGRLAAAVLVAVAALAPPPAAELGLGAVLAAAAIWALPAGPGRGAVVLAVLAVALGAATARRLTAISGWSQDAQQDAGGDAQGSPSGGRPGSMIFPIALCFGWQVLLRNELLFAPGRAARPWLALLLLPLAAGAALALLWRRHGMVPALAAAGAAMVLAPGLTVATTLALVALAGGSALAAAGEVRLGNPLARLAVGLAALALPLAWEPRSGWVAAVAGLALWRPTLAAGLALPLAAISRLAALPGVLGAHASWREGMHSVAWLAMLVPAGLLVVRSPRGRALLLPAALLAFAAPWLPDRAVLAGPIALAALALPAAGTTAGLTAVWSAAVLLGTALLASYPWMRQDPLGDALGTLGAGAGPRMAAAIAGATWLAGAGLALVLRSSKRVAGLGPGTSRLAAVPLAARVAAGAIFAALVAPQLARPGAGLLTSGTTVLLDGAGASWHTEMGPRPVGSVVLESSMTHSGGLAGGTPVAYVRLLSTGHPDVELVVRAGLDTGEWAARRPDVEAGTHRQEPRRWLGWVAGDFFGQRYRSRLLLPRAASFARLRIDLAAGLPPDVGLALYQVELEP